MGSTLAQKILARHSGGAGVRVGDIVTCSLQKVMATDITAPLSIEVFHRMGGERVFDPGACILVNDHFVPAKDIVSADFSAAMRRFAREQGIGHYFEVGRSGICHGLVGELCLALPGEILVGADSHTCTAGALGCFATGVGSTDLAASLALGELWFRVPETLKICFRGAVRPFVEGKDMILRAIGILGLEGARYDAVEFHGDAVAGLPMADRFTLCNMSVEMGAKTGLIPPDEVTLKYVRERTGDIFEALVPDADARYGRTLDLDVSGLEPQVAEPFSPANAKDVRAFREVAVDQVFIGSCTNGSLEDLRRAASVLRGRRVAEHVRCIVTPATQAAYLGACREGLVEVFAQAGAAVTAPSCGACLGAHSGVLGHGEVALATTSRNFRGRMGAPSSRVYLSNPQVAAATAVTGRITHPADVVG